MTLGFFKTRPQATTDEVPSQEEIEREIAKLSEDSAKDVQRQLEQQHLAEKEERIKEEVKEEVKKVEVEVEDRFASARKAKEQAGGNVN